MPDEKSGRTDVMTLFVYDESRKSASLLRFPCDTYAEIQNRVTGERKAIKLSDLYARFLKTGKDPASSARALCSYLTENLGIPVSDFVLTGPEGVRKTVDLLGGIPVTLNEGVDCDDETRNLSVHLRAGTQTLNGAEAEAWVRYRAGLTPDERAKSGTREPFLAGVHTAAKKALSSPGALVSLLPVILKNGKTSLSLPAVIRLARQMMKLGKDAFSFPPLPGMITDAGEERYFVIDRRAAASLFSSLFPEREESVFDPHGVLGGKPEENNHPQSEQNETKTPKAGA